MQGAATEAGEVHGEEAKEHKEQHGHCPLADSRGRAHVQGVQDNHGHDEDGGEAAETQAQKPNPVGPRLGQAFHPPGQKEL